MADRIRILLIDDQPDFASDEGIPRLPVEFKEHFELLWIQNEREARWVLDAFELLSVRAPLELSQLGLPSELLIFDYALTQFGRQDRPPQDSTYPIFGMKELLIRYGIEFSHGLPHIPHRENDKPPSTGADRGKDRNGCFVGVEFARAFAAHPCGAVPTTAHMETAGTDAAFYEWLNKQYFMDLFKDKSRPKPSWEVLVSTAVKCLRERLIHLAAAGVVRIDIEALQGLGRSALSMRRGHIAIHSRFGRRLLPVEGLFIDFLSPVESEYSTFVSEAEAWTRRALDALFRGQGQSDFLAAKEISSRYWAAFVSEAHDDRSELSELAALVTRSFAEEAMLDELCYRIGVSPSEVRRVPDEVHVTRPGYIYQHWRKALHNDIAARWAALLLTVRVEQDLLRATPEYQLFFACLRDEDKENGEVDRRWIEKQLGKTEAARMIEELSLTMRVDREGGETYINLPSIGAASLDDVLCLLDPLPESVLGYLHKGKIKDGRRGKMPTILTNPLKRLGHKEDGWGPLGLSLFDVLDDQPFDCELCQQAIDTQQTPSAGEHVKKDGKKKYRHGIRRGEGQLLRTYADEIGFPETKWPTWLRNAP